MQPQLTARAAYRATVLALTWLGGIAGHHTGDYLVQHDTWARHKQDHTHPDSPSDPDDDRTPCQRMRDGHRSLTLHALSYGATQFVTKAIAYRTAGVRVPLRAQLAGTLAEALLHAVIDDGRLLRQFACAAGKLGFHDLNAGGINGRMLLDQAVHNGLQQPIGAIITAVIADRQDGARR